jgi:hypothetical protein
MKYSRVAAIIAGSVVALGAGSSAHAASFTPTAPMNLNVDLAQPLRSVPAPAPAGDSSTMSKVTETARDVINNVKGDGSEQVLKTVDKATSTLSSAKLGS